MPDTLTSLATPLRFGLQYCWAPKTGSTLFRSKGSCPYIHLSPRVRMVTDILTGEVATLIDEDDAYTCFQNVYPRADWLDFRWWRHYHGFYWVFDTSGLDTSVTGKTGNSDPKTYLGLTDEGWEQYDAALAAQPGGQRQAGPTARRPQGRPPKGAGFVGMPHPRRAGRYVQTVYDSPALIFHWVESHDSLGEPYSACSWQKGERMLTTVEAVHSALVHIITEKNKVATGAVSLPLGAPVTHADALMWLYVNGASKHLMTTEVATGARRTVYSMPMALAHRMKVEYQREYGTDGPLFFLSQRALLGIPGGGNEQKMLATMRPNQQSCLPTSLDSDSIFVDSEAPISSPVSEYDPLGIFINDDNGGAP